MKLFSRNKNLKKGIIIFGILLIIPLLIVMFNVRPNLFGVIKTNQLFLREKNIKEFKEEKIYNHAKDLSVTLLDEEGKIISSTDREKEIDSDYQFTETEPPTKYITVDDHLSLSIEMGNFFDEKGNILINDNTYYYLDIPSFLIPDNQAVVSIEDGKEIELFKSGHAKAFGGIYEEGNTGYRFKIRFEDIEDISELSANFQFTLKLSNTIYNQTLDLKTLVLEDLNNLQFWLKNPTSEPPVQDTYPYELTNTYKAINSGQRHKYIVTLKDKRSVEEAKTKGTMTISFGEGVGMDWTSMDGEDYSTYSNYSPEPLYLKFSIYANDEELSCIRNGNTSYICESSWGSITIKLTSFVSGLEYRFSNPTASQSECKEGSARFACLVNGLSLTFVGENEEEIHGITEWKVEVTSEFYTTKAGTFTYGVTHNDTSNSYSAPLSANLSVERSFEKPVVESSKVNQTYLQGSTPKEFTQRITIASSNSNYAEIEIENAKTLKNDTSGTELNYYINTCSMIYDRNNGGNFCNIGKYTLRPTMDIYLDGTEIEFETIYALASMTVGEILNTSSAIQKQMLEVLDYNYDSRLENNSRGYVWQSKNKYNGKNIYVLISPETHAVAYRPTSFGGITDYATTTKQENGYYKYIDKPNFKFYIFNIEDCDVKIDIRYKLGEINRLYQNNYDKTLDKLLEINTTVKNSAGSSKKTIEILNYPIQKFTSISGEKLNNGYIKWDIQISTLEESNIDSINANSEIFIFGLSKNQELVDPNVRDYYDIRDGMVYSNVESSYYSNKTLGKDYLQLNSNNYYSCHEMSYFNNMRSCDHYYYYRDFNNSQANNSNYSRYGLYNKLNLSSIQNIYVTGLTWLEPISGTVHLTLFTKEKPNNNDDLELSFEYVSMGLSTNEVTSLIPNIYYTDKGVISSASATKPSKTLVSTSETSLGETTIRWKVSEQFPTNLYRAYLPESNAGFPYSNYEQKQVWYKGIVEYTDKMTGPGAEFTKIKRIEAKIDNSEILKIEENEINALNVKRCNNDNICMILILHTNLCRNSNRNSTMCLTGNYGNNYLDNLKKMSNGFSVIFTGLGNRKNNKSIELTYDTVTDEIAMRNELLSGNNTVETRHILIDPTYHTLTNDVVKNDYYNSDWRYSSYTSSNDYRINIDPQFWTHGILADISIKDNIKYTSKYLINDTAEHDTTVQIGYSSAPFVDINDSIVGINNIEIDSNSNSNSNITHLNSDEIKQLKKYLELNDIIIRYYPPLSDTPNTIYSNGEFKAGWTNSTFTINESDNNTYSVHLENEAGLIPMGATFVINYNLTFDIDNHRHILTDDTDPNSDVLGSYRTNNNYTGGYFIVANNPEAVREYEQMAEVESTSTNPKNYVDYDNHQLHVFSNSNLESNYLSANSVKKGVTEDTSNNYNNNYTITVDFGSAGKTATTGISIRDELTYSVVLPRDLIGTDAENKANELNELLLENTKILNIEVFTKNPDKDIIYQKENLLEPGTYTINKNGRTGSIKLHGNDHPAYLEIILDGFEYCEKAYIEYDTIVDFETFYRTAITNNLLDSNLKIVGTDYVYDPQVVNTVASDESSDTASSGYINIKSSMPTINKNVEYPNDTDEKWTINATTGMLDEVLKITDEFEIEGSNAIKNSIEVKDVVIKVNDEIVYQNNAFVGNWGQNIKINNLSFEFKNSDSNSFVSNNSTIEISYVTHFDLNKYKNQNGVGNDSYLINNEAYLEKGYIKTKALATTKQIEFDYQMDAEKTYKGNKDSKLEYTKWQYIVDSKELNRKNVVITDTSELSSEFGKYLSVNDLSIKLVTASNEEIVFNHKEELNNLPSTIHITDKDGEGLEFNKNGEYQFIIKLDELPSNTQVVVDYELVVDREKYETNEEPTDVELIINNNLKVEYDDTSIIKEARGSSVITSELSKSYRITNKTTENVETEWTIDVNLDAKYPDGLNSNDEVTITDELYVGMEYIPNSLEVSKLVLEGIRYTQGDTLNLDTDYTFEYENNTIVIKILNPDINKNVRIVFKTNLMAPSSSISIQNSATISVNGKSTHANSNNLEGSFTTFVGGTVTSRGVTYYTIHANKYLDGKLSDKEFAFELKEVDSNGKEISNGLRLNAINDENGLVVLGPIKFTKEGIHYYQVKEKMGSEKIKYDENSYTIAFKVVNNQNQYIIENVSVNGKEEEKIAFHNTTIKDEPTPEEPKEEQENDTDNKQKDNPDTVDYIKFFFVLFPIILIIILVLYKYKPKKYS